MKLFVTAVLRALYTQLHPRMLWLALWPFLLSLVFWGVLGYALRQPALEALHDLLFGFEFIHPIEAAFRVFGVEGMLVVLVPVLYGFLVLCLAVLTALLLIATVAMPTVVAHISRRQFPRLERHRGGSFAGGIANACGATLVFLAGWILTMPLWLVLPLAVLAPWFWWAWLSQRVLAYDALALHASSEERDALLVRHRWGFFAMGALVAALNFVPPLFFIAPIFAGIAFTHYALALLAALRGSPSTAAAAVLERAPSATAMS